MLHIIITEFKLLVQAEEEKLTLPHSKHITPIEHHLENITKTDRYVISSLASTLPEVLPNSLKLMGLRQALNYFDEDLLKTIIYYQQLSSYYATHKYCGVCGAQTKRQDKNKFVHCPLCKHEVYPHIAPSIIVRIHKGGEILMARGVNFPPGVWGLIAGFVEIGESLEEAVQREVKEEVGIEIKNICYWGSQPWPFPSNSLMIGFTAEYKAGEIIIDPVEIEQAGFYTKDNCPGSPSTSYSIANQMISEFLGT